MPINDLDLENVEAVTTYEEIEPLVHKISHQNRVIRDQIKELKRTQAEFNVITSNMKEGLLVLDLQGKILSYNKSVKKLLNISSLDDEYLEDLSIDDEFKTNINNAIHGTHMSDTFEYGDRYLSLYCNPVEVDGKLKEL